MTGPTALAPSLRQRTTALRAYLGLFVVLVIAALLYLPMVFTWFQTDDFLFMKAFHSSSFAGYVKGAFDVRHAPPFPEVRFYRPLHSTVFLILYHVFGLQSAGYHVWSLGLHLLNTCLVWTISRRLTKQPLVAGLAAGFFALHPAYTPAVAWISNDNALMATATALFAFWCFMNAEEQDAKSFWYVLSAGSFGASLLFHPEAGSMIVVLFAYRLLFSQPARGTMRSRDWLTLIPFVIIALGYLTIHRWMLHKHFLAQADSFHISTNMIKLYLSYFSMCVYPVSAVERATESMHQAIFALAMLCVLGVLLYQAIARGSRAAALAVVWYLVALAPLTTGWGIIGRLIDGRKLYVAGPALALVLALFVAPAVEALAASPWRAARATLVVASIGVISLAGWRIVTYENQVASAADQSHSFLTELQATYREIPPGTRLIVVGAPLYLVPFLDIVTPVYLQSLVGLYYQDVNVVIGYDGNLPASRPGDLVFRYQPPP